MRRALGAIAVAGALLLSLTACGNADAGSVADIHRLHEFKNECHKSGGYVTSDFWNNVVCLFDDGLTGEK